jgi:hypothetical protein
MSLLEQLHAEHKERRARWTAKAAELTAPKPIPIVEVEPEPAPIPVRVVPPPLEPIEPTEPRRPTLKQIIEEIAAKHGLTVNDVKCAGRHPLLIIARREYCYRAMVETLCSLPTIAHHLGGRDHTTALHHAKRYCEIYGLPYPRGARWGASGDRVDIIWTAERIEEYRRLRAEHTPVKEISARMGISLSVLGKARQKFGISRYTADRRK